MPNELAKILRKELSVLKNDEKIRNLSTKEEVERLAATDTNRAQENYQLDKSMGTSRSMVEKSGTPEKGPALAKNAESHTIDSKEKNHEEIPQPRIDLDFEEILKQNERRIYYHMHRLGIRDPYGDFYAEGLFALWMAYKKYEPDKGPLSTYFNFMIRNRLIDKIRQESRAQENKERYAENAKKLTQNRDGEVSMLADSHIEHPEQSIENEEMWREVRGILTDRQWDWVYYHIIQGMKLKEIAEMKGVSVEAVKSWGKEARRKLRQRGWKIF